MLVVKNLPSNAGDARNVGLTPGSGRSFGVGNGNHSSILAWQFPWTEEPIRLPYMRLQRDGLDWATEHIHSVQSLSHVQLFAIPWTKACQASLSITNSWSFLRFSPSSQWCHPTISSSVVPFSSCLQYFPAWGSFLMSQFFTSGSQSTGSSASTSVPPMNI